MVVDFRKWIWVRNGPVRLSQSGGRWGPGDGLNNLKRSIDGAPQSGPSKMDCHVCKKLRNSRMSESGGQKASVKTEDGSALARTLRRSCEALSLDFLRVPRK